jgi:hypothetical protein
MFRWPHDWFTTEVSNCLLLHLLASHLLRPLLRCFPRVRGYNGEAPHESRSVLGDRNQQCSTVAIVSYSDKEGKGRFWLLQYVVD